MPSECDHKPPSIRPTFTAAYLLLDAVRDTLRERDICGWLTGEYALVSEQLVVTVEHVNGDRWIFCAWNNSATRRGKLVAGMRITVARGRCQYGYNQASDFARQAAKLYWSTNA